MDSEVMMDSDSDGDIRIKFDDDGSVSSYIKTYMVQVVEWHALEAALEAGAFDGATLSEADFRTACREGNFVQAWRKTLELPDTTVDQAFEAAVRQRKVDVMWRWADTEGDGVLQKREDLKRLASALGGEFASLGLRLRMGSAWSTPAVRPAVSLPGEGAAPALLHLCHPRASPFPH